MFLDSWCFQLKYHRNHMCGLTGMAFVFWGPQLLKLDMVCRIPSNTVTIARQQNEEYLQTETYIIITNFCILKNFI